MTFRTLSIWGIMLAGFCLESCRDLPPGPFQLEIGDPASVDVYLTFDPIELELISEYLQDSTIHKIFSKSIDLNGDEIDDLNVVYEHHESSAADPFYFSFIECYNSSIQIIGETRSTTWGELSLPKLLREGEIVEEASQDWMRCETNNPTYLSYVDAFNTFSSPPEERFLVFQLPGVDQQTTMGWIRVKQLSENWELQILDLGYGLVD